MTTGTGSTDANESADTSEPVGASGSTDDATAGTNANGNDRDASPIGDVVAVGLVALFVTALVTAQVTATKLVAFQLPVSIPLAGDLVVVPAAVGAYALTFFASDCYTELYGRRAAQVMVNVAFFMSFVLLALLWIAIALPVFANSPVGAEAFATVLGASLPVVVGSLAAYLVSQNWDVIAFHRLGEYTDGAHLWLRNVGSTTSSQAIDTVIFITLAFWAVPSLLGMPVTELADLPALIVGQFLVKLLIALGDTPFVYAVVGAVRSRDAVDRGSTA